MKFTTKVIIEDKNYSNLSTSDKSKVKDWIDDRLIEFREELDGMRGRNVKDFRAMVEQVRICGDRVHFHMLPGGKYKDLEPGFSAEISDGYLNDDSGDEIDLNDGAYRIWFDYDDDEIEPHKQT